MTVVTLFILAYLLGSVSNAVWISKQFFHKDIRDYGSGNAGATNTFRVFGIKTGIIVLLLDMLKGAIAVKLGLLLPEAVAAVGSTQMVNMQVGLGLTAVLGHIFPVWFDFKGGKGIATLFGMILAIQPWVALSCVGVFAIILFFTKYVSLSSILAGIAFPLLIIFIFREQGIVFRIFAIVTALLIVLTHQKNIGRLLKGTENKINKKKEEESDEN